MSKHETLLLLDQAIAGMKKIAKHLDNIEIKNKQQIPNGGKLSPVP